MFSPKQNLARSRNQQWRIVVCLGFLLAGPLLVLAAGPPINDSFTNRTQLVGVPVLASGSNEGATREPGDPSSVGGRTSNTTVWWSWTAPKSGRFAAVIAMAAPADPGIHVYTYSPTYWLIDAVVPGSDDSFQALRNGTNCNVSQVLFDAVAGTEYEIITGAEYPVEGPFEIAITEPPTISSSVPSQGADFSPGSNVPLNITATDSDGSVVEASYSIRFGPTLAQTRTAPFSATWTNASIGRYHLITRAIDNFAAAAKQEVDFTVGRPINDDFTNRIHLTGVPVLTNGPIYAAGKEPLEGSIGYFVTSKTVWWSWTAPSNGLYAIVVMSTNNSVIAGVYTGSDYGYLISQGFTDNFHNAVVNGVTNNCSQINILATAGTEYQIQIDGGSAYTPQFAGLSISVPPTLQVTSPTNGAVFASPSNIPLSAEASDSDGFVKRVKFREAHFENNFGWSVLLGDMTNAPWSTTCSNASVGTFPIVVEAFDNLGARTALTNRIWVGVTRPVNDDFAQRIIVPDNQTNTTLYGANNWATVESWERYAQRSVWWCWTAPASGLVTIDLQQSTTGQYANVYEGSAVNELIFWAAASPGTPVTFTATAGRTYDIAISGPEGNIVMNLQTPEPPPRLANFVRTNGQFQFSFSAMSGKASVVESSSNLVNWLPFLTNAYTTGVLIFKDTNSNFGSRFYRVREQD